MNNVSVEAFRKAMIGKKVAVLGIGVSNLPALDFLNSCGALISACDRNTRDKMSPEVLKKIDEICENAYLGEDYLEHLDECEIILKSPGINPALPQIVKAYEKGIEITSEMEIFMSLCPCKMIGVTGSDGKTTTTTLIHKILTADGYCCHVGGNIGTPLINRLDEIQSDDIVVLELSSFQLMNMRVSPDIAVVTNVSPNHLDYHKDMNEYIDAKANIFLNQKKGGKLVINKDNDITFGFASRHNGVTEFFSRLDEESDAFLNGSKYLCYKGEKIVHASDIKIKGMHNVENYLAAIAATRDLVDASSIEEVAKTFGGVEHRMEFVRTVGGVSFYNDSIGSSPARTCAGLIAHEGDIVLIAGGYDKNLDYDELGELIRAKVSVLVLIGATSDKIYNSLLKACGGKEVNIPVYRSEEYPDAVKAAYSLARGILKDDNDVSVILSPASASFDMFKNFEVRGNHYKELVNALTE